MSIELWIPGVPDIIGRLEDFFSSPAFTTAIGDFLSRESSKFTCFDVSVEQPLEYFDVYYKYQRMVEASVEEFLAKEGVTSA